MPPLHAAEISTFIESSTMSRPVTAGAAAMRAGGPEFRAFIIRLHFYIGLFVGPFILVAIVTGTLFVLTPQLEAALYADQLQGQTGVPQPLAAQAQAARAHIGPEPRLFAVRPAPEQGATTRVMFTQPGLGDSESRAIFVDPVSLEIKGDLIVYGTSGNLPFRTTLDYLHRHLLLGEIGRTYSELAASWLWIAALGGIFLWSGRGRSAPNTRFSPRRLHGTFGIWLAVGLLFLSVTGLTWSRWAGDRIDHARSALGWVTPSVSTELAPGPRANVSEHAAHIQADAAVSVPDAADPASLLDTVWTVAREAGIDSSSVEIRPAKPGKAWLVREYDRSWPTQVDTLAVDPRTMTIASRADFETFPLLAKLIRWGIDAHMGILFGLPNQIVLAALGLALITTIALGYLSWWRRRPSPGALPRTVIGSWNRLSWPVRGAAAAVAALLGWALPVMGVSLALFILIDALRWRARRMLSSPSFPQGRRAERGQP
jgi:uncharacterized iron-regulated membrane protein